MNEIEARDNKIRQLQQWVADLQDGGYVNCVYCGKRYGPRDSTPTSLAEILKAHVRECPDHPMAALQKVVDQLVEACQAWMRKPYGCTSVYAHDECMSVLRKRAEALTISALAAAGVTPQ